MAEKRIVVLNNEVYEVSEGTFNTIMGFNKKKLKLLRAYDEKRERELHEKNCKRIRKYGKLLMKADIMLRDD